LYRLSEFVTRYWQHKSRIHHQPVSDALQFTANQAWMFIDWVPARITAVSFAVVGSFEEAIDSWRNYEQRYAGDNDGIILAATSGAVNIKLRSVVNTVPDHGNESRLRQSEDVSDQSLGLAHLAVIVGLVWRTVVMWMVLLALLTLARLLG
jgi:adenosylcobinamide-phosphate synthase